MGKRARATHPLARTRRASTGAAAAAISASRDFALRRQTRCQFGHGREAGVAARPPSDSGGLGTPAHGAARAVAAERRRPGPAWLPPPHAAPRAAPRAQRPAPRTEDRFELCTKKENEEGGGGARRVAGAEAILVHTLPVGLRGELLWKMSPRGRVLFRCGGRRDGEGALPSVVFGMRRRGGVRLAGWLWNCPPRELG